MRVKIGGSHLLRSEKSLKKQRTFKRLHSAHDEKNLAQRKTNRINYLLFLLLALFWSGSFLSIKITVETFPPVFCAMIRLGLSLVIFTLLFAIMRKSVTTPVEVRWRLWMAGLFTQGIPFALLFYGEKFIAPAIASIINSTVPIWVLLINLLFIRSNIEMTITKIAGLIVGLGGVVAIFWPQLHTSMHTSLWGLIAVLGMALFYALGALLTQRIFCSEKSNNLYANLWHQNCSSVLFLLMISLLFETWPSLSLFANVKLIIAFVYLGLFSTAIAWIIYFHLIRSWDAVRASSVMYVVPLLAICWDFLFLHITPSGYEFMGALLILLGVTLIQLERKSE